MKLWKTLQVYLLYRISNYFSVNFVEVSLFFILFILYFFITSISGWPTRPTKFEAFTGQIERARTQVFGAIA